MKIVLAFIIGVGLTVTVMAEKEKADLRDLADYSVKAIDKVRDHCAETIRGLAQ